MLDSIRNNKGDGKLKTKYEACNDEKKYFIRSQLSLNASSLTPPEYSRATKQNEEQTWRYLKVTPDDQFRLVLVARFQRQN